MSAPPRGAAALEASGALWPSRPLPDPEGAAVPSGSGSRAQRGMVLCVIGPRPLERDIVSAAGLRELATTTRDDYVESNVRLASDGARRDALRRSLRARLEGSPLMDSKRFSRDLESLYRRMCDAQIA